MRDKASRKSSSAAKASGRGKFPSGPWSEHSRSICHLCGRAGRARWDNTGEAALFNGCTICLTALKGCTESSADAGSAWHLARCRLHPADDIRQLARSAIFSGTRLSLHALTCKRCPRFETSYGMHQRGNQQQASQRDHDNKYQENRPGDEMNNSKSFMFMEPRGHQEKQKDQKKMHVLLPEGGGAKNPAMFFQRLCGCSR